MGGVFAVLLPVLVVAGAFMWLKPSKRDQHLAKIRSKALGLGFRISSLKVPDTSEYGRVNEKKLIVTMYQRSLVLTQDEGPSFTVVRTTGESGVYLPDGWQWDNRKNISEDQYNSLSELLNQLPSTVSVVSLSKESVGFCWNEDESSISFEQLKNWLFSIASFVNKSII